MADQVEQRIFFGEEAVEQVQGRAKERALEVYNTNTKGVLLRPNAKNVSSAVAKAVVEEVLDVVEDYVAKVLDNVKPACDHVMEAPLAVEEAEKRYEEGVLEGLRRAHDLVAEAEGKPGKRQLAEMLSQEVDKAWTRLAAYEEK